MRRRDPDELTDGEREVLELLRRDFTNEQIAARLGISLDGAKYHVSQILSKLGVATREEAAALALGERRRGWAGWPVWAKIAGAATVAAAVVGLALLAWGVVRTSDRDDGSDAQGPRIDSISPSFGTIGTEVVIRGSGFDRSENDVGFTLGSGSTAYQHGIPSPDGATMRFTLEDLLGACAMSQLSETESCFSIGFPLRVGELSVAVFNANGTSNTVSFRRELSRVEIAQAEIDASASMQELTDLLDGIVRAANQSSSGGAGSSSYGIGIHESSDGEVYIRLELNDMDMAALSDKIPNEIAGYEVRLLDR